MQRSRITITADGQVRLDHFYSFEAQVAAEQSIDSRVVVTISPRDLSFRDLSAIDQFMNSGADGEFHATTARGERLSTETLSLTGYQVNGATVTKLSGHARSIDLIHEVADSRQVSARFHITNLQFTPDRWAKVGSMLTRSNTAFQVAGRLIHIRHRSRYRDRLERLKATKNVDVLNVLDIPLLDSDDCVEIEELATRLCDLLSLASGNFVTWIQVDYRNRRRQRVRSRRVEGITRPFVSPSVLPTAEPGTLPGWISAAYGKLRDFETQYPGAYRRPLQVAIRMLLDAHQEGVFLQTRTLVALAGVEFMARRFLQTQKRLDFGRVVDVTSRQTGIVTDTAVRSALVRIRNSLIHQGSYDYSLGTEDHEQHYLVTEYLARVLLAVTGYRGDYISPTKGWVAVPLV